MTNHEMEEIRTAPVLLEYPNRALISMPVASAAAPRASRSGEISLSRHDNHARYVVDALVNHKPVLVEKPLAINREQLEEIRCAYRLEREKG